MVVQSSPRIPVWYLHSAMIQSSPGKIYEAHHDVSIACGVWGFLEIKPLNISRVWFPVQLRILDVLIIYLGEGGVICDPSPTPRIL